MAKSTIWGHVEQCLQRQGIFRFSRTRVKENICTAGIIMAQNIMGENISISQNSKL